MASALKKKSDQTLAPTTIFGLLGPMIQQHKAVNIASGFPDFEPPAFVREGTMLALQQGEPLQYSAPGGDKLLKEELCNAYSPLFRRQLDADKEVTVTLGGGHAIFLAMKAVAPQGGKIVIFEPFFSFYGFQAQRAGLGLQVVALSEDTRFTDSGRRWQLCERALREAIDADTKAILLNTPHNPTGKVFTHDELTIIANVARELDLCVISDEVYEFMVFPRPKREGQAPPPQHHRIATYPDMWWRTITCSSASKTFSVTGFRIGWCLGPNWLISACTQLSTAHVFAVATPLQRGVAAAFRHCRTSTFLEQELPDSMSQMCGKLLRLLQSCFGHENVVQPQGGYFIVVDISHVPVSLYSHATADNSKPLDFQFALWLIETVGIACFPMTGFYGPKEEPGGSVWSARSVRFCYAKTDAVFRHAEEKLGQLKLLLDKAGNSASRL